MRARSLKLQDIKIKDSFWSKHVDLVKNVIIPYQWEAMNDRIPDAESSHCLENFRIAAGETEGEFYGMVFQDSDIAKWLEAVGFSLATNPDKQLEQLADDVIDLICRAQCEDGYLNTYFTIKEPERRWKDLCMGHELYCAGHMMEAAVAYYQATGKDKFLNCLCRFADLICDTFGYGENQIPGYPGHEEIEIGLIKLYEVTGIKKYLNQAKYFIDARGVGKNYFIKEQESLDYKKIFADMGRYDISYSQSHLPVREQKTAEGHSVRAVYLYCAMADLAYEYQDESLLDACKNIWNNIIEKRMYITGGIGSSGILERFTVDYDLPNEYNYSESCASIGLALFALRMAQITKDASYMDVAERALYNTVLAGIALDGKSFFYVNPLEVWPEACKDRTSKEHVKPVRQKWFGVACCPPNIARTLASIGQYVYGWEKDEQEFYVNLFISNEAELNIGNDKITVKMETKFPWENVVRISLSGLKNKFTLRVRIPDYACNYCVTVDKECCLFDVKNGYALLEIEKDAEIIISFDAPPQFVRANPLVRANVGKVAVVRGPLVYCLEEVDNGDNLACLYVDSNSSLQEVCSDNFGGCVELLLEGERIKMDSWEGGLYGKGKLEREKVTMKAIPYPYWCNRTPGEMTVWIKEV